MFCYRCGKEAPLVGGLCRECYAKEHSLFSMAERYAVVACKTCDSFQLEEWMSFEHVEDIVERLMQREAGKLKLVFMEDFDEPRHEYVQVLYALTYYEEGYWGVQARFLGFDDPFSSIPILEPHDFELHFKFTVCPSCSKKYGGYYEAVLQIRRDGRFLTKEEKDSFLAEVTSLSEEETRQFNMGFITQVRIRKEGIDFQMGSLKVTKKIARALQSRYGGTVSESYRLCGFDRQAGKERYRTTVVLRLSSYEEGRFVFFEERLWKVAGATDKLILRSFAEERVLDFKKVEKEQAASSLALVEEACLTPGMIASLDDDYAEVLLMDTYETIPLSRACVPEGAQQGDAVRLYERDGIRYIVSP